MERRRVHHVEQLSQIDTHLHISKKGQIVYEVDKLSYNSKHGVHSTFYNIGWLKDIFSCLTIKSK